MTRPPALSPEEWAECEAAARGEYNKARLVNSHYLRAKHEDATGLPGTLHALAALCLHEQEFGFHHVDVFILQNIAHNYDMQALRYHGEFMGTTGSRLRSLADRIEALLKPEAP